MKVIITNIQKITSKKGEFHIAHFVQKDGKTGTTFISPEQAAHVKEDKIVPIGEPFKDNDFVFDLNFDQNGRLENLEPLTE